MYHSRTTRHENGKYGSVYFLSGSFSYETFSTQKSTEGFVGDHAQYLRAQAGTAMFHFLSWEAQGVLRAANENIVIHVDSTSIGKKKNRVKGN
jgi:hypothetical protein